MNQNEKYFKFDGTEKACNKKCTPLLYLFSISFELQCLEFYLILISNDTKKTKWVRNNTW